MQMLQTVFLCVNQFLPDDFLCCTADMVHRPTHSIWRSALSSSVTPCALAICRVRSSLPHRPCHQRGEHTVFFHAPAQPVHFFVLQDLERVVLKRFQLRCRNFLHPFQLCVLPLLFGRKQVIERGPVCSFPVPPFRQSDQDIHLPKCPGGTGFALQSKGKQAIRVSHIPVFRLIRACKPAWDKAFRVCAPL